MPTKHKKMIAGWKKLMPDYTFVKWDESNFDIHCCAYAEHAYKEKKYAYVSDVARCYALAKHGGIYLDTDVNVFKPLDPFLHHSFFSAQEIFPEFENSQNILNKEGLPSPKNKGIPYFGILSSIIGAEPNHPIILDALEYYGVTNDKRRLLIATNIQEGGGFVIIDGLLARIAIAYGYRYKDEKQYLEHNAVIYPTGIFGYEEGINPNYIYSYHLNLGSWAQKSRDERVRLMLERFYLSWLYVLYKQTKNVLKRVLHLTRSKK